jgi:hypothetical protein
MNPLVFVALLALLLTGCKRHETSTGTAPNEAQTSANAASPAPGPPIYAPTEPVVVQENADTNATLDELSSALRAYVSQTRSAPKDFQDFVNRAQVQAPAPPAGKAYAIVRGKVVFVNK